MVSVSMLSSVRLFVISFYVGCLMGVSVIVSVVLSVVISVSMMLSVSSCGVMVGCRGCVVIMVLL